MPALCRIRILDRIKMVSLTMLNKKELEMRIIETALVTIRYTHVGLFYM